MTAIYNVGEAKTHLSELLKRVEAGEDVMLARGGRPIARIVPLERPRRRFDLFPPTEIAPDFDEPLPEDELELWEA